MRLQEDCRDWFGVLVLTEESSARPSALDIQLFAGSPASQDPHVVSHANCTNNNSCVILRNVHRVSSFHDPRDVARWFCRPLQTT